MENGLYNVQKMSILSFFFISFNQQGIIMYMYLEAHSHIHARTCTHTYQCTYTHVCVSVYACIFLSTYACAYAAHTHFFTSTYVCASKYGNVFPSTYIPHFFIRCGTHNHTHIHMHTHSHTYPTYPCNWLTHLYTYFSLTYIVII